MVDWDMEIKHFIQNLFLLTGCILGRVQLLADMFLLLIDYTYCRQEEMGQDRNRVHFIHQNFLLSNIVFLYWKWTVGLVYTNSSYSSVTSFLVVLLVLEFDQAMQGLYFFLTDHKSQISPTFRTCCMMYLWDILH